MMNQSVKVFAPATVANVTCGFDILGFAVHHPGDEIVLEKREKEGLEIVDITGDGGVLPREVEKNTVSVAITHFLKHLGQGGGFNIYLHKKMPLGSGLGSSAASAVAGVFAANLLLGKPLTVSELLPFAMQGEALACGEAHADNVAPALLGGFVLVRSYEPLDVIKIASPSDLHAAILHPQIEIATKDARSILKKQVPIKNAIRQWGNVAGLITGLITGDYPLIGRSMEDVVVEPVRSMLIPGFDGVKSAAIANGALGCGISGSGPSMFALCKGSTTAQEVGTAMAGALENIGIDSDLFVSEVNQNGPLILSENEAV